jgi:hypothetical protein
VCVCVYPKGNDADEFMVLDAAALLDTDEEESGGATKKEDESGGATALAPAAEGALACCFTRDLAHPELLQFARFLYQKKKKRSLQNAEQEAEKSTSSGWFDSVELVRGVSLEEHAMECPQVLAALAQVSKETINRSESDLLSKRPTKYQRDLLSIKETY